MVEKKGMTMALSVIISIVVLIVVALAIIAITGTSLTELGGGVHSTTYDTQLQMKCQSWFSNWCITHPGQNAPTEYPSYEDSEGTGYSCDEVLGDPSCSSATPIVSSGSSGEGEGEES